MESLELKVLHARQPLFVIQSDGTIQNRYTLKVLNKMNEDMKVTISVDNDGYKGLIMKGAEKQIVATHGTVTAVTIFVKVPRKNLTVKSQPIMFTVEGKDADGTLYQSDRESVFIGPKR
ncbi:MAG: hypothetical protein DRQ43_07420 [Gammaproteobacteria bacterium]|nr:MAG: hypothetical protein DRQ43_07420 [Gammaproteobacteria bacterium]